MKRLRTRTRTKMSLLCFRFRFQRKEGGDDKTGKERQKWEKYNESTFFLAQTEKGESRTGEFVRCPSMPTFVIRCLCHRLLFNLVLSLRGGRRRAGRWWARFRCGIGRLCGRFRAEVARSTLDIICVGLKDLPLSSSERSGGTVKRCIQHMKKGYNCHHYLLPQKLTWESESSSSQSNHLAPSRKAP